MNKPTIWLTMRPKLKEPYRTIVNAEHKLIDQQQTVTRLASVVRALRSIGQSVAPKPRLHHVQAIEEHQREGENCMMQKGRELELDGENIPICDPERNAVPKNSKLTKWTFEGTKRGGGIENNWHWSSDENDTDLAEALLLQQISKNCQLCKVKDCETFEMCAPSSLWSQWLTFARGHMGSWWEHPRDEAIRWH